MSEDMETNFVVVGAAARHNSSVDMEGYSLLPDIIWTPGPDMLNSQFGKVIFTNVKDSYSTNEDIFCKYSFMSGIEIKEGDRVAIFCVGWRNIDDVITWVMAAKHPWPNEELTVVFPACQLPPPGSHFYQFCYLSAGEVRGASIPFNFVNKPNVNAEDQQKAFYLRNHPVMGQINVVSSGESGLHSVASGYPQNLALPSNECHPGTSDEPLRPNTADSDDTSCSEVTSSEEYAPNSQNEKQKNMNSTSLQSTYKDPDTSAVASTSEGANGAEIAASSCLCIAKTREQLRFAQNDVARSAAINNELRKKILDMENEKQMLLSTMSAVSEENARLRARLNCEIDRNQALGDNLLRSEAEVGRQIRQYDIARQNNAVVIKEMENEIGTHKMKIAELNDIIQEKETALAYYSRRLNGRNEQAAAVGGPPQLQPHPGQSDGQLEQERHVDIGANSGMQRQNIRPASSPYHAAVRKTRNYYVTFLSDKADIEKKVFALSCTKLSLVKKLHTMKARKDTLMSLEYQYYTALQNMHGVQNSESRRILEAVSEVTAEQRALDQKAFMEVDMIDEIKNRLEINRQNTNTLRAKAIEVYNKFLESYNYSKQHNSGAAQDEWQQIKSLYGALDDKFNHILFKIQSCADNMFIWE